MCIYIASVFYSLTNKLLIYISLIINLKRFLYFIGDCNHEKNYFCIYDPGIDFWMY